MENVLVSVYDLKADDYSAPFMQRTTSEAIRNFTAQVNDDKPNNMLFTNPEDFRLVRVGYFDTNTGVIGPAAESLVTALSVHK